MGGLGKNIVRAARGAAALCIMLLAWHVVAAEDDEVLREAARADPLELMHAAMQASFERAMRPVRGSNTRRCSRST